MAYLSKQLAKEELCRVRLLALCGICAGIFLFSYLILVYRSVAETGQIRQLSEQLSVTAQQRQSMETAYLRTVAAIDFSYAETLGFIKTTRVAYLRTSAGALAQASGRQ